MDVSIVISTYGDESWRELALDRAYPSALDQGAHEIVVGHDDRASIAQIRNTLAEKTSGDWLCFLDADDELHPDYVRSMQRAFRQGSRGWGEPPPLLTPAIQYVQMSGKRQPPRFWPIGDLRHDNFLIVGTLVYKELFMGVGGFEDYPHGFEDWSLWAKCWKAGAEIVQVRRAIYIAHINNNSKHRQGWRDRKWQVETHQKIQRELFPELT